jgi:hypothetical protein
MPDTFKRNVTDYIGIIDNFLSCNLTPTDPSYEVWKNHLLIKTYTLYEQYYKRLLKSLKDKIETQHQFLPIVTNHKPIDNKFVAPTKSEVILQHFPLLQKSYYYEEYKIQIDSIIVERNNYAHEGNNQLTIEVICSSSLWIQYTIRFIQSYYDVNNLQEKGQELTEFLSIEKEFLEKLESCLKNLLELSKSNLASVPQDIKDMLISLKNSYISYQHMGEQLDISSIDLEVSLIVDQELFLDGFENQSPIEILQYLQNYKKLIIKKLFGIDSLGNNIPLDKISEALNYIFCEA